MEGIKISSFFVISIYFDKNLRLTDKQLKRFTEVFEIKAKSIIMIDKGRKVTIVINGVRIFDVKKELVQEFL